ncbi:sensor histidine kinase [Paenibacillus sp. SYP-B4298]|uniref:sensor histidine kinase n=1 Tax=Paenibacillus sp. SYP-B4298 TaxID=2996034 RepID=UPI0022DD1932|nr:sensor histidine kinase [Paenibacillus sp. SYP-B4298]
MNLSIRLMMVLMLFSVLLALPGCNPGAPLTNSAIKAAGGVLDLREADLEQRPLKLEGEWVFYPSTLTDKGSVPAGAQSMQVYVPSSWNNYKDASLGYARGMGYGTYALRLLTPPGDYVLSLRVPNISSSYKLWVDGKPMAEGGMVGIDRASSRPDQAQELVSFYNGDGYHEIVVEVSNFYHRRGGIWTDFYVGGSEAMNRFQTIEAVEQMGLFGSLSMIGFYHLGLFVLRRKERFTLYFGLLCLLVSVRIVVVGDVFIMQWLPVAWEAAHKIEYISLTLSALTGYLYVYFLFPADASRRFVISLSAFSAILCLFVLLTPANYYSRLLWLFQAYVFVSGFFSLYALVQSVRRRREGSLFVLTGMSVFVVTVVNDVSFYNEWFGMVDLIPSGLLFFIMMQAFIISSRFSHALRKVEEVSAELKLLNMQLEERIADRTRELLRANAALEQSNRDLERQENSRRRLLTNISHDLRTPITLIQGYLEAMHDGVVQDPLQQKRYVGMMLHKVNGLNHLINDLFELSKLEAGQVNYHFSMVRLEDWAQQLQREYRIDLESRGMTLVFEPMPSATEADEELWLWIDEFRMAQMMSNLIDNAAAHMAAGGTLTIALRYEEDRQQVEVRITDTGSGITEEDLPHIFERFYKNDKSRNSAHGKGSGIGLSIVKEIVLAHQGQIRVESRVGVGSVFTVTLPAEKGRPLE